MSKIHSKIEYTSCSDGWNETTCHFRTAIDNSGFTEIFYKSGEYDEESIGLFCDDDIKNLLKILNG